MRSCFFSFNPLLLSTSCSRHFLNSPLRESDEGDKEEEQGDAVQKVKRNGLTMLDKSVKALSMSRANAQWYISRGECREGVAPPTMNASRRNRFTCGEKSRSISIKGYSGVRTVAAPQTLRIISAGRQNDRYKLSSAFLDNHNLAKARVMEPGAQKGKARL
jgi:hypothetical protein